MPFTLRNLQEDLEDVGSRFDGAPNLGEARREDVEGLLAADGGGHGAQEAVYVALGRM